MVVFGYVVVLFVVWSVVVDISFCELGWVIVIMMSVFNISYSF